MIRARCYSDDHCVEVDFDATPWFEQASDTVIAELAMIGWGGDDAADNVCDFMEATNRFIQDMKTYIGFRQNIETIGYECHINKNDAMNWLELNRPRLWELIERNS